MNVLRGQWLTPGQQGPWPVPDQPGPRSVLREDLTAARYRLIVAPEVVRELGGEPGARAALAGTPGTYRCPVCGNRGRLDRGSAASVMVLTSEEEHTPRQVRLAHPGCSDSTVRAVPTPEPLAHGPTLPATAWLRPADAEPAAVVVLSANVAAAPDEDATGPLRALLTTLLTHGFETLADPEAPLPPAHRLTAQYAAGCLTTCGPLGQIVWSGQLTAPQAWTFAALRSHRVGLVVAAGRWGTGAAEIPGLEQAINEGHAVGVSVPVTDERPGAAPHPLAQPRTHGVLLPLQPPPPATAADLGSAPAA